MSAGVLHWFRTKFSARRYEEGSFASILATYKASSLKHEDVDARMQELGAASETKKLSSADVCELELLRLRICSENDLLQAIPELRRKFALLTGRPPAKEVPSQAAPDKAKLLAEASYLTVQIMQDQDLQELFTETKASIVWRIGLLLLLGFGLSLLVVSPPRFLSFLGRDPTIFVVMIVGACGGFVSVCRRVYQMDPGQDLMKTSRSLRADLGGLIAKPLLGGAFAAGLYLLFIGKMVTGTLFPTIQFGPVDNGAIPLAVSFKAFFTATVTATDADFAKLLVWCFIAGFAERFVPDILDRLGSSDTSGNGRKTAKKAPEKAA